MAKIYFNYIDLKKRKIHPYCNGLQLPKANAKDLKCNFKDTQTSERIKCIIIIVMPIKCFFPEQNRI